MAKKGGSAVLLLLAVFLTLECAWASEEKPAVFVLGDSTADVGTNNFLPGNNARADFPHNGIDFPHSRATGRFSNGLNSADFLAKLLGHKRSPPPFLSLNSTKALKRHSLNGMNFASGGSGILDMTGVTMMKVNPFGTSDEKTRKVITLSEQIMQFSTVRDTLTAVMGATETEKFLVKSLLFISIDSNDILLYHHSNSTVPKQEFIATLGSAYENHLKTLWGLGARKFGIISVPPIGCCPSQRVLSGTGECLEVLNELAIAFHSNLGDVLKKLSSEYEGMKYSLGNAYDMAMDVIVNPLPYFKDVKSACCGSGTLNAEGICDPKARLCSKRNEYLFWDLYHATQAASKLAAVTLYTGGPRYVTPMNFSQLASAC
ncbi:hypothetical protein ACJRO7_035036 [Eucalyptus globulus]|uniref:GDSL esterase/lipase n=1 Tax=Eucalyptus globulus TaxID=34317 RepID=A0ABD3J9P8_EUCGL